MSRSRSARVATRHEKTRRGRRQLFQSSELSHGASLMISKSSAWLSHGLLEKNAKSRPWCNTMVAWRWYVCVVVCLVSACAGRTADGPPPSAAMPSDAAVRAPSPAASADDEPESTDPAVAMTRADAIYRDQLAVQGRDERFSTDRQVTELRRAIALYQQFIARADGDPRFAEAVKRSRARIQDAQETIAFLLASSDPRAR
jgi:hypothetical protein